MPIHPRRTIVWGLAVTLLLVTACSTPYQELGPAGGYHDFKIEENRHYIYFGGNAYTTRRQAFRNARYRAAELAREHSTPFFRIVEVNRDASRYKAKMGSDPEPTYEMPVVTMVVTLHSSRPAGNNVYRTDEILEE